MQGSGQGSTQGSGQGSTPDAAAICPDCGHENPAGSRFCGQCGTPVDQPAACPSCDAELAPGQRFCHQCGAQVADERTPEPTERSAPSPAGERRRSTRAPEHLADKIRGAQGSLEGERKQVTVLFADVMGSMDLAERTETEEWRRIMERFFAILSDGVHRFEGTVDKFTGDGIMAIFGAPIAHEDHARRACLAALHLRDELAAFAAELRRSPGINFLVRFGLNSGEVVVGTIGEDLSLEYTAVGHTVGLAQRMEALAEPGKPYLTAHTAELVAGYFELAPLGEYPVRGSKEPLEVYELAGLGSARGRLDLSRARGFSRFVGRAEEMATLESALERSLGGAGQAIGIVGEAGVGKSRLCHEFAERCRERGIKVYETQGQAHARSIPFLPVLRVLRGYFGVEEQDSALETREKIAGRLLLLDESFGDDLPLLFDFLGVTDPEHPAPQVNPEARQRRLLAMIKRLLAANSRREPSVHLFEDLHWIDPGTEMFLAALMEAIPSTRHLTVLNFRPEYSAGWMRRSYYRQLPLAPLGSEAIGELLAELLGEHPSLNGLPDVIRERTAGNPFFVEELVRELAEDGTLEGKKGAYRLARPVEATAVPATVQTILAARIDRLPEREKGVLQAAAVIGKEFTEPVLARVCGRSGDELEEALRDLCAAEFVYEVTLYPEAEYAFRHPLTREVAYGSQLSEKRSRAHAATARAIEELHPEGLDERAGLLAYHWERAGEELEAARWHARAAVWAGYSGPHEAIEHWRRVRELTMALPDGEEVAALGKSARTMILQFAWRLGLPDEEVAAVFEEGRALAEASGDDFTMSILLATYGTVKGMRGDVDSQVALCAESIERAERVGAPALIVPMLVPGAYAVFTKGLFAAALERMDRVLELTAEDRSLGAGIGVQSPHAWAVMFRGNTLAMMGRIEEGAPEVERGVEVARAQGDTESVGWARMNSVNLARLSGDAEGALAHARQALEIAERLGDGFSRMAANTWLSLAHLLAEEPQEAAAAARRSLEIGRERQTGLEFEPFALGLLAEALAETGDHEEAVSAAEEGIRIGAERGALWTEALAQRGLARALLATGDPGAMARIEAALGRVRELIELTGGRGELPLLHVDLAALAELRGDEAGRRRELEAARELALEMGASGHARRISDELAMAETS